MAGSGKKVVVSAIVGNSFITLIKFIGWFFSKSPSLLAEAVHSFADTLNQILLLIGLVQSTKPESRSLPVGSGGARYLWNLISAVGIFFIGFGVTFYHGIHSLMSGHYEVGTVSYIGIVVLVISLIVESYVLLQAVNEVKKHKGQTPLLIFLKESDDPTLVAVLLEDGVAVLGVTLALVGMGLGQVFQSALFDIFASIGISLLLGFMAVALGFINSQLLIGKSIPIAKEQEIQEFISSLEAISSVEKLSTRIVGTRKVRLSFEAELNIHGIINMETIMSDADKISSGESTQRVLLNSNKRVLRATGRVINHIEVQIHSQFPEISIIDFELN